MRLKKMTGDSIGSVTCLKHCHVPAPSICAAWISDSGRYHVAFVSGFDSNAEIEPYPSNLHVHIAIGAIVDIAEWPHELPLIAQ